MSTRSTSREIWVGLIVIVAVAGLIGLVGLASDGPGFLAPQRTIDVVFRDGQGIRDRQPGAGRRARHRQRGRYRPGGSRGDARGPRPDFACRRAWSRSCART